MLLIYRLSLNAFGKITLAAAYICISVFGVSNQAEDAEQSTARIRGKFGSYLELSSMEDTLLDGSDSADPIFQKTIDISKSIKKYVISDADAENTALLLSKKNLLKFLSFSLGSTGGVPFLSLASKAAGDNEFLKWLYILGTLTSNGFSTIWALNNSLNYFNLEPMESPSKSVDQGNSLLVLMKHFLVNTLSLLDSVPITYAAYTYNDQKIYPILAFFSEYGFRMSGYYRFFDDINALRNRNSDKYIYLSKIKSGFSDVLSMHEADRNDFVKSFDSEETDVRDYVKRLSKAFGSRVHPGITVNDNLKNFIQFIASPIYVSNAVKHAVLAYNGMNFITKSPIFAAFSSSTSTVSSVALNFYVTRRTIESVCDYCFHGKEYADFTSTYFPNTKYFIPLMSLVLAGLSSWSFSYITYDTLVHSYFSKEAVFFTITTAIAGVIIDSFAMRHLTDETVMFARKYAGNADEVRILKFKQRLDNFYKIVSAMSEEEFNFFKERFIEVRENSSSDLTYLDDGVGNDI